MVICCSLLMKDAIYWNLKVDVMGHDLSFDNNVTGNKFYMIDVIGVLTSWSFNAS